MSNKYNFHGIKQACLSKLSQRRQVAYEAGFSNLSYFSKVFKKEFGELPSEFTVEKMD